MNGDCEERIHPIEPPRSLPPAGDCVHNGDDPMPDLAPGSLEEKVAIVRIEAAGMIRDAGTLFWRAGHAIDDLLGKIADRVEWP